jgi:nicotinate-nucleotide adenylyltransferase
VTVVGVFGGSFNPPHVAHVLAAAYALSVGAVDEVLVVPVFRHPFAKELAPFDDRLRMCELAFSLLPSVRVSAVERELGGESLTLHTVEHLRRAHPEWSLRLLIGSDVVPELDKWHRWSDVARLAPPFVLQRAGSAGARGSRALLPDVSSTEVRALFARGDDDELGRLVPRQVVAYARGAGLYQSAR